MIANMSNVQKNYVFTLHHSNFCQKYSINVIGDQLIILLQFSFSTSPMEKWKWQINNTRNFSRLRRLNFLFMGNMSPYYFKTIFTLCMKYIPSFIKIGGAVSEKNGHNGQTFVVLYIGYIDILIVVIKDCICKILLLGVNFL